MNVLQPWLSDLPVMQQTVLLTAIRGPDVIAKYHRVKFLLRWFRRCVLMSAMDGRVLLTPVDPGGGSFTGPSYLSDKSADWPVMMEGQVSDYLTATDELPHHFQMHFMHATEILGYKHPDDTIRSFWYLTYVRLVRDMHLYPESRDQLDERLGDTWEGWAKHADPATRA